MRRACLGNMVNDIVKNHVSNVVGDHVSGMVGDHPLNMVREHVSRHVLSWGDFSAGEHVRIHVLRFWVMDRLKNRVWDILKHFAGDMIGKIVENMLEHIIGNMINVSTKTCLIFSKIHAYHLLSSILLASYVSFAILILHFFSFYIKRVLQPSHLNRSIFKLIPRDGKSATRAHTLLLNPTVKSFPI